jgi:hypothetical protein
VSSVSIYPSTATPREVAEHWLAFQQCRKLLGDAAYDDSMGAQHFKYASLFAAWAHDQPELTWATIVEIWQRVDRSDMDVLAVLGAGEVEDLLCNYGEDWYPTIERFCEVEPEFKTVLRMVWQSSMRPALWQKIQDLRGGPNL